MTLLESIERSIQIAELANCPVQLTPAEGRALLDEIERLTRALATITQHNSDEVDEYNAGFDAGKAKQDRQIAYAIYREAHPETPAYDVFDTGWVMGALDGDADNFDKLTGELARFRHVCPKCGEVFYGDGEVCIECA